MYEIDFLPVGDGGRSGDAIAMRFTRPSGALAHVIIDAGFKDDGEALVEHVQRYYDTSSIDLAILTHPDGDHIGGMGVVVRELDVGTLWLHSLGAHGGASLDAADAVDELIGVASDNGTDVAEPFAGSSAFGEALRILGPTEAYYDELVERQLFVGKSTSGSRALLEATRTRVQRFLSLLPIEVPFDEGEGTSPRNNSSIITMLEVDGRRLLFTADAGVAALDNAWDYLNDSGLGAQAPDLAQIPHHGSRRNASTELLNRLYGGTGQSSCRNGIVSVSANADAKHPSPRVVNAYMRRGFTVLTTAGSTVCFRGPDTPSRAGWGPVTPLAPMDESAEE
jgi:beta-lactamase superfamily II metal-dependent hydrolase